MEEVKPRKASTVIVLRPSSDGFEIFMVQRNRRTGFMPNAWVFPGGRVDEEDAAPSLPTKGGVGAISAMELEVQDGRAFLVAALRETFEETGIWLGQGELTEGVRDRMMSGACSFESALRESQAIMELDRLHPWSWWVTPKIEPRRYDTRFFLAITDGSSLGRHDERESVNSDWLRPSVALKRAAEGDFPLAPPTWWTLKELATLGSLDAVKGVLAERIHRPIQPVLSANEAGEWMLKLPGHPEHPDPPIMGLPVAVRFEQGRWWATD